MKNLSLEEARCRVAHCYMMVYGKDRSYLDVLYRHITDFTHADYKALEEINRKLVDKANVLVIDTARLDERIQDLTSELAQCRRDAERYQWLRDWKSPVRVTVTFERNDYTVAEKQLDRLIDASRNPTKEG